MTSDVETADRLIREFDSDCFRHIKGLIEKVDPFLDDAERAYLAAELDELRIAQANCEPLTEEGFRVRKIVLDIYLDTTIFTLAKLHLNGLFARAAA